MINKAFENGMEKYALRDLEGAVLDFTLALEKDPSNPEIFYQRGMSYFHLKKKGLALLDMDSAIEVQPNYSFRYSSRAFMRDSFGDVLGAISDYRQAIELDPDDAIAYNNLGILEDKMGRKEISKGYFAKADSLIKNNDNSDMNDMSSSGVTINYERKAEEEIKPETVDKNTSFWKEFGKVFTDKSSLKEFVAFVKAGFRLPK